MLDDRLLIEELLVGLPGAAEVELTTTSCWYFRACRAAVLGAGGQLSGPFRSLDGDQQETAIISLLELRPSIGLNEPRVTVPLMADIATRHPQLNPLNLEAVAAARSVDAEVWLSAPSASGLLPSVLDAERVDWATVAIA